MNIILLGSPASGKGTQAERLSHALNLYHFKTGDLARQLAEKDTRLKKIVESGELVPEGEMSMYVIDFLARTRPNFSNILFEGFPRFISQYEALEGFLIDKGDGIDAAISLDVTESEAINRISSRRTCSVCGKVYNLITNPPPSIDTCTCGGKLFQREDDTPESIKVRFDFYHKNTKELIDYLKQKGKLIEVNGEGSIEIIFNSILEKLRYNHVIA